MLILDRREPESLENYIRSLNMPVTRDLEMEYGDCCFTGNRGEFLIGFERKKLGDLINSMKDRRLSGRQLRGCWEAYNFVYLVAEGGWREGGGGEIEEWGWDRVARKQGWVPFYSQRGANGGSRAVSYEQLDHYLCTLELGPSSDGERRVILKRTRDEKETARFYVSRWRWFNQKRWKDHTSDSQIYCGVPAKGHGAGWGTPHDHDEEFARYGRGRATISQEPPTTAWRMAAQLPGLDRRAATVARHFGTVRNMANATEKEWLGIDFGVDAETGRKRPGVGKVTAAAVVRAITVEGA